MLVLMAGLPGTGKTTLARELAARTCGHILNKDEIRQALFADREIEYSTAQDDFCLQLMLETAAYLLRRDTQRIIFLDGRPFSRRYQIDNALHAAIALHQPWRILECVCPQDLARLRLAGASEERQAAARGAHPAENRNYELYLQIRERFEAIAHPKIIIDTAQPLEECIPQALAALR